MAEQCVTLLQFQHLIPSFQVPTCGRFLVPASRDGEPSVTESPSFLVQLDGSAFLVTEGVRWIVKGDGVDRPPVKKIDPRIVRIGVIVENVSYSHSADLNRKTRDIDFLSKLQLVCFQLLLFPSETNRLSQEQVRNIHIAAVLSDLVGHGVREIDETMGKPKPKTLVILAIEIELASGPEMNIQKYIGVSRLPEVVARVKAVRTAVRRVKAGLALQDFDGIEMNSPVLLL